MIILKEWVGFVDLSMTTPYFQNEIECKITNKIHVNGQAMNKNMFTQSASGEYLLQYI